MSWPHKKTPRRGDKIWEQSTTGINSSEANGVITHIDWDAGVVHAYFPANKYHAKPCATSKPFDFDELNGAWNIKLELWEMLGDV